MIIDVFCHHIPSSLVERVGAARAQGRAKTGGRNEFRCPLENGDPEARLALMDKYGVDVQALSLTTETLYGFSPEEAADICRIANDANRRLCERYPDRFVNVCAISLLDVPTALDELARGLNELDCRAAIVSTNQHGKGLDSPDYYPFYEVLAANDLPLLLHPTFWESYPLADESQWTLMSRFGWPFDSTQAVWRLIFGGVFDRFPTLKVVMHHLGGMFPYFTGRIESGLMKLSRKPSREMSDYFKNVYGDSAVSAGPPEVYACGYAFFGPDRVVYGSDYPFGAEAGEKHIRGNLAGLQSLNIPASDKEKILGGNARRLLKIR